MGTSAAHAVELERMRGDARVRAPDNRLLGSCKGASIDIFYPAAQIADEVVMMAAKGVRQLVTREPLVELQAANDAQIAQELGRAVNRHAIDGAVAEAGMDLFDAKRRLRAEEHVRHRAARLGQTVTGLLEQGVYAVRRNGYSHMIPHSAGTK